MPSLRDDGAVLLLSLYELGHSPNGLAMPLAFLRRAGFTPSSIDTSTCKLDEALVRQAHAIIISVPMHTALRLGVAVIDTLKRLAPQARLVFTGIYAPLNETYLKALGVDAILGGEYEEALVELLDSWDNSCTEEKRPTVLLDRLRFPTPDRTSLPPLTAYARMIDQSDNERLVGYTETTRGCLDTCRHCPVPAVYGGRLFAVPRNVVLDDIAAQVERGAQHITFGDPDFLNGRSHGMRIIRELHHRWPDLSFDITAQVTHLLRDSSTLPELRAAGCAFVVSAFESLSDTVLDMLGKQHRRDGIERLLERAKRADVAIRPTFVPFTPWTVRADIRELVDFIAEQELVEHVAAVQLSIRLLVPPGSLLLANPATASAFGTLDRVRLTHTWQHDDCTLDRLQRELAAIVERAVASDDDALATFHSIRSAVYASLNLSPPSALVARPRRRVPRVTEPWFC